MSVPVAILAASTTCVSLAAAIVGQLRRLTTRLEKRHRQAGRLLEAKARRVV
jgi:hypothetical protein